MTCTAGSAAGNVLKGRISTGVVAIVASIWEDGTPPGHDSGELGGLRAREQVSDCSNSTGIMGLSPRMQRRGNCRKRLCGLDFSHDTLAGELRGLGRRCQ